jgi:hypothetical protein
VASPAAARSSSLPQPAPDHPGPFLRLDHSSDQGPRAAETLAAGWERFERGRRWRLFLLVPGLTLAAAACALLDVVMGFHVRLATWYAPILIVAALLARSTTRPAGRAEHAVTFREWWRAPSWRAPLASCRELLAVWADPSGQVRGWIDLTGAQQRSKLVPGRPRRGVGRFYRDVWCRLSIETRRLNIALRAVEERLVLPDGHIRCRRRVHVVAIAREPYGRPPQLRAPAAGTAGRLQILRARAHRHRLSLRLKTPRRGLFWPDLAEILRAAGASVPLA